MAKFHINREGVVKRCTAQAGRCPFGEAVHYDTKEDAEVAANELFEDQYGLIAHDVSKTLDGVLNNPDSITNKVLDMSKVKTRGFQYECFAAERIAEEMGLDQVMVLTDNGIETAAGDGDFGEHMQAMSKAIKGLTAYYDSQGIPIDNPQALTRVVYYSKDSDKILVQSGGPNVLDAAVIEADSVVDMIEVKRLNDGGAQMASEVLETDVAGSIKPSELDKYPDYLQNALRTMKMRDANGRNPELKLTNEEALTHFVEQYKAKGAKTFVYTTNSGQLITEDFTKDTDEIVRKMNAKGVEAKVMLRANYGKQNMTETELDRFDFYVGQHYFKDGMVPMGDTFKVKDLNRDDMVDSSGYIRIGQYILPVKTKDLSSLPDDYEINKMDMEYFPLTLTGTVKVRD